jgi:L-ribulose-5-phosphate 3-epimerase
MVAARPRYNGQRIICERFLTGDCAMIHAYSRRQFLATSAAAGLAAWSASTLEAAPFKTTLKKALIGNPNEATMRQWKEAGFQGIEAGAWDIAPAQAEEQRKLAEKVGLRFHAVMRGWANFNSPDESLVQKDLASVERALKAAAGYGADAVLLVPCRVDPKNLPMPEAWEFEIAFDEKTGRVTRIAAGDNARYEKYIAAHNHATETSRKAVEKLIPAAEKARVVIALENVWNNLWVQPKLFANFVKSFQCPWVQCYFDIGNHVKYAMPEEWIRALGKTIVKCHVKDFKLNPNGQGGKWAEPCEGSINWPLVRRELDAVGYNGWMTIEGSGGLTLRDRSQRLDKIFAGE